MRFKGEEVNMNTPKMTVVGLGSGDEYQITLGIWRKIQNTQHLYLRTKDHPIVRFLQKEQITYHTFDHVYETFDSFPAVYDAIVNELIALSEKNKEEIIYAVPGHPMVAEATVKLLKERCAHRVELTILGGESFLDQAFLRLGFDPIEGFLFLDGSELSSSLLQPSLHTIIAQVYDQASASDVKLSLMELYPDDYPIIVGHSLGLKEELLHTIPLYEMDRIEGYGNLSMIWIPRSSEGEVNNRLFSRLKEIVAILRSPEGCPWDREQTHSSIRKNLLEEAYEVIETIDDDDPEAMCEELGDLLMQVMLHSEIESEVGTFNVYDVIEGLNKKLIRRHPHVFADKQAGNAQEALINWQTIKEQEKREKGLEPKKISILSGIPRELPGLLKAFELQKRAANVGFDWEHLKEVVAKIDEELIEFKEVMLDSHQVDKHKDELGDLLFAVVNAARFMNVDPEEALASTNRKFMDRFAYIEQQLRLNQRTFEQTDLMEMEKWWQEAKG